MALKEVYIPGSYYDPDPVYVEEGDEIIWYNDDGQAHTATAYKEDGSQLFNEYMDAGAASNRVVVDFEIPDDGLGYECTLHDMNGTIRKKVDDKKYSAARQHEAIPDDLFTVNDWRRIAQIVAANYVYDLSSDFKRALDQYPANQGDHERVADKWAEIQSWWSGRIGAEDADISPAELMKHSQYLLEQHAHRLRAAWVSLSSVYLGRRKSLVTKFPNPDQLNSILDPGPAGWGQSSDPFGKAITVLPRPRNDPSQWTEVGKAFLLRVNPYAIATYYGFIEKLEQGKPISRADRATYRAAKSKVSAGDYQRLAAHQSQNLARLWGTQGFDEEKFIEGIWRMTLNGDWQSQERALWHWLRFIDMYLFVKGRSSSAPLPDLLEVSLAAVDLFPKWGPGMTGLATQLADDSVDDLIDVIKNVNERLMGAFNAKDAEAVAALYTDDGLLSPPHNSHVRGKTAIAEFWEGAMNAGLHDLSLTSEQIEQHDDVAHEIGVYTLKNQDGQEECGKFVVLWRLDADGQWKLGVDIWNQDQ